MHRCNDVREAVRALSRDLGGAVFKIENGTLYWSKRGADTWLPFRRRDWEMFAIYGGVDPIIYESHDDFLADTKAFTLVVSSTAAINYLLSNTALLSKYLNDTNLVKILVANAYFVSSIKANNSLISLLISNTNTLSAIRDSSTIKTQTSNGTVNGIVIQVTVHAGGQFWGYQNGTGSGSVSAKILANSVEYLSVSASGRPSSGSNHVSYGKDSSKYNTTMTGLSNTFTLSVTGSANGGTEEHSGSMVIYYI